MNPQTKKGTTLLTHATPPTLSALPERITNRINLNGPIPSEPSRPIDTPCWIWEGGKFPAGYGSVWLNGKNRVLHQVVLELFTGVRTDRETYADHACRVRACCNPEHLDFVTPLGNMLTAQRPYCRNGHEYTPENTHHPRKKPHQRVCRACARERTRRHYAKKKES